MIKSNELSQDNQPKRIGGFAFKSKTIDGRAARILLSYFNNNCIKIEKVVISVEDLTKHGFKLIRGFKSFGVYSQSIFLKNETFGNLSYGFHKNIGLQA